MNGQLGEFCRNLSIDREDQGQGADGRTGEKGSSLRDMTEEESIMWDEAYTKQLTLWL